MDNVTHSLFAATLAHTPLRRAGTGTTAALLLASNAPDIDIITALSGGAGAYLSMHRGPTHGLIGLVALAIASGAIVRLANDGAHFGRMLGISLLGVALHILMDLPTSYGTRLLTPFNGTWYALDWLPIIDVYLLGLLGLGLIAARLRPGGRGAIAAAVLVLMAGNYTLRASANWIAQERAIATAAEEQSPADLPPCEPRILAAWSSTAEPASDADRCGRVAAIPSFVSPLRWRLVRKNREGYELMDFDLRRGLLERVSVPDEDNDWVDRARRTPLARTFLGFARLPAAHLAAGRDGAIVVSFSDLRFVGGPFRVAGSDPPRRNLFVLRVTLGPDGAVLDERLGD